MKNPVNVGNKRVMNIPDPRWRKKDCLNYKFFTDHFFIKPVPQAINCQGNRLYNMGSYTNNDQLITGIIIEQRYLRKNLATINMNAKRVTNARNPINNNDLATKAYVDSRSINVDLTPF